MPRNENPLAPFPWSQAIGFGLGVLRLSPEAFWRMTPRELAHAIRAARGAAVPPLDRGEFARLMMRYPDRSAAGRAHEPVEVARPSIQVGDDPNPAMR